MDAEIDEIRARRERIAQRKKRAEAGGNK